MLAMGDVANPGAALHLARMAKRLTPNVTIYTDGAEELSEQIRLALGESDIKVDNRRIVRLEKGPQKSEVIVHLEDGTSKREGFLVLSLHSRTTVA